MKALRFLIPTCMAFAASPAFGLFLDGNGHYGLLGETRTNPGFSKQTGTYQTIRQSLRLEGEARIDDKSSVLLELRLSDNPREQYLGDQSRPRTCEGGDDLGRGGDCDGRHQSSTEPGYKPYQPVISEAYVRYAFDYCVVEAGRRDRDWGLGIFLDDGDDPFEWDASVFDGITCDINIQKSQILGFSIGYDKLAESGTYVDPGQQGSREFGASDIGDDLDQFYLTIQYDDRKANAGANFTKHVGIYFSQVSSAGLGKGGSNTDLKFLDLYTGFFFGNLSFQNEILFRMGKTADPNVRLLGGAGEDDITPITNEVQSIGIAGLLEWTLARSGAPLGPSEYNLGDVSRHVLFADYSFAPGDTDGYKDDSYPGTASDDLQRASRNNKAEAMAFHTNYKPALILFNGAPGIDSQQVDGVYNPTQVMNASVFGFGYRYESLDIGDFEAKLIKAQLNEGAPGIVIAQFDGLGEQAPDRRPVGYFGTDLGFELDLSYGYKIGRTAIVGAAFGYAVPGDGARTSAALNPSNSMALQTFASFNF